MLSFKKLEDILGTTVKWELQMQDLYDVAEIGLKTKEAKELPAFLKESHVKHLKILQKLEVKKYGPDEWINFMESYFSPNPG